MIFLTLALLLFAGFKGSAMTPDTNEVESHPDLPNNGDICKDCTQIFELLVDLLSNPDLQNRIITSIESLCAFLPGPAGTEMICITEVKKLFPTAISFIIGWIKPAAICKKAELCNSGEKQTLNYLMEEVLQAAETNKNGKATSQCSFCLLFVKTLEAALPKERTEDAVIKVLGKMCQLLPPFYRNQCETIIKKFSKTVIDAILSYATPHAVCSLLHLCKGQETLPVDPCTMPTYSCRDIQTALQCGNLFYCQRFYWKPLKSNSIY